MESVASGLAEKSFSAEVDLRMASMYDEQLAPPESLDKQPRLSATSKTTWQRAEDIFDENMFNVKRTFFQTLRYRLSLTCLGRAFVGGNIYPVGTPLIRR